MSPPPYTTILLCPLRNAYCIRWFDLFEPKNNVPTTMYHYSTAYCIHYVLWFDLFVSKTMSPPPYTTILLCPLCTAYCIHWFYLFAPKNNVPTTIYHYSTAYCIHCILSFDLFVSKTMSPPPYTTILLRPLRTASTPLSHFCVILPQPDIHYWYYKLIAHTVCLTTTSTNTDGRNNINRLNGNTKHPPH